MRAGAEPGVSEGGGLGGGNGWSIGVPYGLCKLRGGWSVGIGMDEGKEGLIGADEKDGGGKKEEGFTRLVTWLVPLFGSGGP